MIDSAIMYENIRYYETRMKRTDDPDEIAVLQAAILRAKAKIKIDKGVGA